MEFYTDILSLINSYGYVLLFLAAAIEGPVVAIIAGFLGSLGILPILPAFGLVVAGDLVGDIGYYAFGRWGQRWSRTWFTRKHTAQSPVAEYLRERPTRALIFAKLGAVGPAFLVTAGRIQVRFDTFLVSIFTAVLIRSAALILFGYAIGFFYSTIHAQLGKITLVFFVGLGIGIIRYVQAQLRTRRADTPTV